MFTLRENMFTMQFKYDFLSYLSIQTLDVYLAIQCSNVEFILFYNRFTLGPII
jgi:hypothetical protein